MDSFKDQRVTMEDEIILQAVEAFELAEDVLVNTTVTAITFPTTTLIVDNNTTPNTTATTATTGTTKTTTTTTTTVSATKTATKTATTKIRRADSLEEAARIANFDEDVRRCVDEDGWFMGNQSPELFGRYLDQLAPYAPLDRASSGSGKIRRINYCTTATVAAATASFSSASTSLSSNSSCSSNVKHKVVSKPIVCNPSTSSSTINLPDGRKLQNDPMPSARDFLTNPWLNFCDIVGPLERWPFFIRDAFYSGPNFDQHQRMLVVNFAVLNGASWEALDRCLSFTLGRHYFQERRQYYCLGRYKAFFKSDGITWNVETRQNAWSYNVQTRRLETLMGDKCDKKGNLIN